MYIKFTDGSKTKFQKHGTKRFVTDIKDGEFLVINDKELTLEKY